MSRSIFSRGLGIVSDWWQGDTRGLRLRRRETRFHDSVPAMIELLEPRRVLTSTTFANTTPLVIPDGGPQVFSDINVAGLSGTITEVGVRIDVEHLSDGELNIFLISPTNQVIELSTGNPGTNFVNTLFTSSPGPGSITAGTAPYTGTFLPEGNLAQLIGANPNGQWRLRLQDTSGGIVGTLQDWSLELKTAATFTNTTSFPIPDNAPGGVSSPITVSGLSGGVSQVQVKLNITHPFDSAVDILLINPAGAIFDLSTGNGGGNANYTNTIFQTGAGWPSVVGATGPFTGVFSPEGNIAANLQGGNPNGTWQLRVSDNDAFVDLGTLLNWSLTIITAPNYTAQALGSTLLVQATNPNYDVGNLFVTFNVDGSLFVLGTKGTQINGAGSILLGGSFNSLTGFFGNGDDLLALATPPGPQTQQSLSLFLSGGNNTVDTNRLNVQGSSLLESSAGRLDFSDSHSIFHGLTVIDGAGADSIKLLQTDTRGANTFLMGGGNSTVDISSFSQLGSTLVLGSNQLNFSARSSTFSSSLTAFSGVGTDTISIVNSLVTGGVTALLGGGTNTVLFNQTTIQGSSFIESGLGSLNFTASFANLGGLLIIGGSTKSDLVTISDTEINGTLTLLLGGGFNAVSFAGSPNIVLGSVFIESSAGALLFTANKISFSSGVFIVGGAQSDAVDFRNSTVTGPLTLILGGGVDQFSTENFTASSSTTLISSGATQVNSEASAPDGPATNFLGPALFILGGGSNVFFGKLAPTDLTFFGSTLTIFGGIPNATLRRRNVVGTGALVTLVNVTEI